MSEYIPQKTMDEFVYPCPCYNLIPGTAASSTKEVNPRLTKRPLKINGRLANRGLTSLVKEARCLTRQTVLLQQCQDIFN